jgi:hypothetical protein
MVEYLKVKAPSSSPSTAKEKQEWNFCMVQLYQFKKSAFCRNTSIPVFTTVLFIMVKLWDSRRCPSIDK